MDFFQLTLAVLLTWAVQSQELLKGQLCRVPRLATGIPSPQGRRGQSPGDSDGQQVLEPFSNAVAV